MLEAMKTRRLAVGALVLALGAALSAQSSVVKPHPQANLPKLDLPAYQLPKPNDRIRAIYKFAAERPDVLSYMPCFCGCEMSGHKSNEDCFVKARAKNGDVTAWQEHGMVCGMCLAVAERAEQLCGTGASLAQMRADIENRYGQITGLQTPTPAAPKNAP